MKLVFLYIAYILLFNTVQAQSVLPKTQTQLAAENFVAKTKASFFTVRALKLTALNTRRSLLLPCAQSSSRVNPLIFSGKRIDNTRVDLFWEISPATGNDYFQPERTLNPSERFDPVATGKPSQNLTSAGKYGTSDPNHNAGYTYYRLKQVHTDGSFRYSSLIAIKGISTPLGITPFPNPGQGKNIAFIINGLSVAQAIDIAIYNNVGKMVYQHQSFPVSPEVEAIKMDLPNLPFGKYSIKIKSRDDNASNSFVIIP